MSQAALEETSPPSEATDASGRRVLRLTLMVYLLLLAFLTIWSARSQTIWDALNWKPNTPNWILQTIGQVTVFALVDVALFGLLAFLCAAAFRPLRGAIGWFNVLVALVFGFVLSLAITLLLTAAMPGLPLYAPSVISTVFLSMVCLAGSWAGANWGRSESLVGWLVCQAFSVAVLITGVLFSLAWFGLEAQPLEIKSVPIATADRQRLVRTFKQHDPRRLREDKTTSLTLTEHDFNQLLTWGLSLLPGDQQAVLQIDANRVSLSFTGSLPRIPVFHHVLNVTAIGEPITKNGELGFMPRKLTIGRIHVPEWLFRFSGPLMVDKDWHSETTRPFFSAFKEVVVEDEQVTVAYGHIQLPDGFVRDALVGIGAMDDIAPAMKAHTEKLLSLARKNDTLTFGQCVQTAFATASERSVDADPIHENRAALLALGYVLGHSRVKKFVGPEIPDVPPELSKKFRAVSLRGRDDWSRHFTLSAALEVLSNELASHAIGVLKEELDADGGTGFSFGDVLADRAGTRLSVSATRSKQEARAMQARLAEGFNVADFMPTGDDLPEGLPHPQFIQQFGGVGDPRYDKILAEIDDRIARCAAYSSQN